jgi:organic radical activating enzyme
MTKLILPFLETMLTQVCNLSCVGCTNYSDLKFSGYVPWEEGKEDLTNWLEKLTIPDFGLIGGEPLINPEVRDWIRGSRELMPASQIRFTTNGLLLEKHFDVVDLLKEIDNSVLKITVHVDDRRVQSVIDKIFKRYEWKPVTEYGIERWASGNFKLQINHPIKFTKSYKGTYNNLEPHNSNASKAFSVCCQQRCPLLYKKVIYKCSTSGLLPPLLEKLNKKDSVDWLPYTNVSDSSIALDSSSDQIDAFIENFGQSHRICRMCPETAAIEHLSTVTFK